MKDPSNCHTTTPKFNGIHNGCTPPNTVNKGLNQVVDLIDQADDSASTRMTDRASWKGHARWNPFCWGPTPEVPTKPVMSPEHGASFISRLTFGYVSSLVYTGHRRALEEADVWEITPRRSTKLLAERVQGAFQRHVSRGTKYPLFWALHDILRVDFQLAGLFSVSGAILRILASFVLRYLIQFVVHSFEAKQEELQGPAIQVGIGLACGITLLLVAQSFCASHSIHHGQLLGAQTRGVLISMIHEKSMALPGREQALRPNNTSRDDDGSMGGAKSRGRRNTGFTKPSSHAQNRIQEGDSEIDWTTARIMSLASIETLRIEKVSCRIHTVWTSPLACLFTLCLLLIDLTYAAVPGFSLLVISLPVMTVIVHYLFQQRKRIDETTGQRVSLMREMLQSIQTVKLLCLEKSFASRMHALRSKEIKATQTLLAIANAIAAISTLLPTFAAMISFIIYSLTNHDLSPDKIFSSLALFSGLRLPLKMLPLVFGQAIEALGSLKKIEQFLLLEEVKGHAVAESSEDIALQLCNASFTWRCIANPSCEEEPTSKARPKDDVSDEKKRYGASTESLSSQDTVMPSAGEREEFKLHNVSLRVGRGELVAVTGPVGSGKSSLLAALAGELFKQSGQAQFHGSIAFCPQEPWIQNTSIRDNITFGKDFDNAWYERVVYACALHVDFALLPDGDRTRAGERGVTISGGQKQRISLARALYSKAEILLLDDPLCAVDTTTAQHVFDHAVLGLAKDKCRVLVTHSPWTLNHCDQVLVLEAGQIQQTTSCEHYISELSHNQTFKGLSSGGFDCSADILLEKPASEQPTSSSKERKTQKHQKGHFKSRATWSVWLAYIRGTGSVFNGLLVILVLLLAQAASAMTSLWLSFWVSDKFSLPLSQYIFVYAGLNGAQAILVLSLSVLLTVLGARASKKMFCDAITGLLRAPLDVFTATPLGRITDHLSSDVDTMDNRLPSIMCAFIVSFAMIGSTFGLIVAFFHSFSIALILKYALYTFVVLYHRASNHQLRQVEISRRSGMFAQFNEDLCGRMSIRSYGSTNMFVEKLRDGIDRVNGAGFIAIACQRWLSIRLDMMSITLVLILNILVIMARFHLDPSASALVLSLMLINLQVLQFVTWQITDVGHGMTSVTHIHHYASRLGEEAPASVNSPPESWPERGELIFDNVQLGYGKDHPVFLQGLNLKISGGERIGIVGRTGAGKTSLLNAVFRLVEPSAGSIRLDGINISTIGLHDLRSRLAIIPQNLSLFRGTVRSNLDPFEEHTDLTLWSALRQVNLAPASGEVAINSDVHLQLDSAIQEEGLNLSLGQRQLMALARALVRRSRVILVDEATSTGDPVSEDEIQHTILAHFRGSTILCVAHRLHTILGFDRIMVMDAGRIAEVDTVEGLWASGGIFREMCDKAGIGKKDIQKAREAVMKS